MWTGDLLFLALALWILTLAGAFLAGYVTGFLMGYLWR